MPRLQITSEGFQGRVIALNLGVNRLGRLPNNHFQIEDPTVSGNHCEIFVGGDELLVRDCDSTNGTYLDGKRVKEARLTLGQILRLGGIECLVEETEARVSVPPLDRSCPAPPRVLEDGSIACSKHEDSVVTHRCPHCSAVMCKVCVKQIRRRGGKVLQLCPFCSRPVEPIPFETKGKRSFRDLLRGLKLSPAAWRKRKN